MPVARATSSPSRRSRHQGRGARDLANAFANQAVAEQTDKLHRQIASQFQGLKAQPDGARGPHRRSAHAGRAPGTEHRTDPTMRVETLADLPQEPAVSPKPRSHASSAASSPGSCSGSWPPSPPRSSTRACAARSSCAAATACRSWPAIPKEGAPARRAAGPAQPVRGRGEAYRTLRATISPRSSTEAKAGAGDPRHRPVAGEGKTTTAINLASSLALTGQGRDPDRGRPPPALRRRRRSASKPPRAGSSAC